METRPVKAELLLGDSRMDTQASKQTGRQTDRQTDMTKVTVALHNLRTRLKM
jgi:hypothetical protein